MTLQQFAQQIVDDPQYRDTITARARDGTLPPDVELFLLETAADVRPVGAPRRDASLQSKTLALIRPANTLQESER